MPTLETDRLTLRMFHRGDFEEYAALVADPEVVRYLGDGQAATPEDAWRALAFLLGSWDLLGYGMWAVEERQTGALVGRVGFHNPVGWPGLEIGWTLARSAWGRGYATEAARACLAHGFTSHGFEHVISLIHPDNHRSRAVAERIGESPEGTTDLRGKMVQVYGITKEAWERSSPPS